VTMAGAGGGGSADIKRLATPEEWTARGAENLPGVIGIVFEKVEPTEVIARVAIR